ncbi:MAG: acetolactate decarboxylase [Acidobacteriota bacterium]|nr:acetolactate decarboxylase [Acidobacteriota bacterium]
MLFAVAALVLPTGCGGTEHRSNPTGYTVEWVGELRTVHRQGDARPTAHLSQIEPRDGSFAIGPLAGLRGEITVIDGEAFVTIADDSGERMERGFDHDAPFLVFGWVGQWQAIPIPSDVQDIAGLEQWLPDKAAASGLRVDEPFPFKVETSVSRVGYHVISNTEPGYQVSRPHRELMRFFTIDSEPVVLIGVHSISHGGVFTHHDQATHLHVVSKDGQHAGHVDQLGLGSNAVLYLPVP